MRSQPRLGAHACPRTRVLHRGLRKFKPLTCTFTLPAVPAAGSRSSRMAPPRLATGRGTQTRPVCVPRVGGNCYDGCDWGPWVREGRTLMSRSCSRCGDVEWAEEGQ